MDVETLLKKKSDNHKTVTESESESQSNQEEKVVAKSKSKKVSKSKSDGSSKKKDKKKHSSKQKKSADAPVVQEVNKKKRKAEASASEEPEPSSSKKGSKGKGSKGGSAEPNPLEKVTGELTKLAVPFDASKLGKVKRHQRKNYEELAAIMTDPKCKGLIFGYDVRTPIGRMFWYFPKERKFKSIYKEHNFITLTKYAKEATLNVADIQKSLTDQERKSALEAIGFTSSDIVTPENWLYALVETGIIAREPKKPATTQSVEAILCHDEAQKQTYWMSSVKGKEKFSLAIRTRTRTIHDNNIDNELSNLNNKRKEIMRFLSKIGCVSEPTTTVSLTDNGAITATTIQPQPKKRKTSDIVSIKTGYDKHNEHEEKKEKKSSSKKKEAPIVAAAKPKATPKPKAKKQKTEHDETVPKPLPPQIPLHQLLKQSLSALVASDSDDDSSGSESSDHSSSVSTSTSESESPDAKAEAELKAVVLKKQQKAGYRPNNDPNATTIAKSLEIKRILQEAQKHTKVIDDIASPEIRYFRSNCY